MGTRSGADQHNTSMAEGERLDANRYSTKKTVAKGMLDIALLTTNASQLKYLLQVGDGHGFYAVVLGLVIASILLQVLVGILFLILGGLDINDQEHQNTANILNNTATIVVFIITLLNVVISGFNIQHTETTVYNKIESLKIK